MSNSCRDTQALEGLGFTDARPTGEGSTALVYRAIESDTGRVVAVKVARDPRRAPQVAAESRLLALGDAEQRLVRVHRRGRLEDGRDFAVLEFCGGGSLADRLYAHGPLPPDEALRTAAEIAHALAAMHGSTPPVGHLDIKPSNLLFNRWGELKLADLGTAQILNGRPSRFFSRRHGAPEQLRGEPVGPATDLYAVGSVLHELLTGQPPFPGTTIDAMVTAKLSNTVPPLVDPRLPAAVRSLLLGLLQPDASRRRPATAPALAAELDRLAVAPIPSAPIPSVPSPTDPRTPPARPQPKSGRPNRRRRGRMFIGGGAMALASVGAALSLRAPANPTVAALARPTIDPLTISPGAMRSRPGAVALSRPATGRWLVREIRWSVSSDGVPRRRPTAVRGIGDDGSPTANPRAVRIDSAATRTVDLRPLRHNVVCVQAVAIDRPISGPPRCIQSP